MRALSFSRCRSCRRTTTERHRAVPTREQAGGGARGPSAVLNQRDRRHREVFMCRSIKTLYNFDPPASDEEIRAASVQFVRKLSGFNRPSKSNELAFDRAVEEVASAAQRLLQGLVTQALPRDREAEAAKARARAALRFGAAN